MKWIHEIGRKNGQKKKTAIILSLVLGITSFYTVQASVINDAQSKKNEAQKELNQVNNEINRIKEAQSSLQKQMDAYDNQLMSLLTDMDLLEADIANKQGEIDQATADLAIAQEKEQTQYQAMKKRIQYMYENGNSNYLEVLMGSADISDLLNRVEYVSEVYDYDRAQLIEYQETVQQVADLKVQLDTEMAEMEDLEISYKEQASSLQALISEKSAQMDNFDSKLASAKSLASQYAATIRQQNQIIANEKARQAAEEKARKNQKKKATTSQNQTAGNTTTGNTTAQNNGNEGSSTGSTSASTGGGTGLTSSDLNPSYKTSVSGSDVVAFASQYVGYPYVYGGNSLTQGSDCSYFVMACFGQYGVSLPRSSYALQSCGQAVSYENARAGDIICYPGHVAIYMGNGRIVHAASPSSGICYGNATYRTILTIRRVL